MKFFSQILNLNLGEQLDYESQEVFYSRRVIYHIQKCRNFCT